MRVSWRNFPSRSPARGVAGEERFLLTFPHTANGQLDGVTILSTVILINNGGANATGTVFLRRSNGTAMEVTTNLGTGSQFDFSLESGEVLRLETDGKGPLLQGWVEVVSDVALSGSGGFTTLVDGQFQSEVGIGDSVRSDSLMVFVDRTDGKGTGIGVANPSDSETANLTFRLKRLDGTEIAQAEDSLGPQNQTAFFCR